VGDPDMLGGIDRNDCSDENREKAKEQLTPLAHFLATRQDLLCALLITSKDQKGSAARIGYADEFIGDYEEEAKTAMGSVHEWTKGDVVGRPRPPLPLASFFCFLRTQDSRLSLECVLETHSLIRYAMFDLLVVVAAMKSAFVDSQTPLEAGGAIKFNLDIPVVTEVGMWCL
jgi:hypothetical protein